jgi:hypothetical protein
MREDDDSHSWMARTGHDLDQHFEPGHIRKLEFDDQAIDSTRVVKGET